MWLAANVAIDLAGAGLLDVAPDSLGWLEEFQRLGLPAGAASWQSGSGEGHVHYLFRRPEGCPIYRLCRPDEFDILTNGYSVAPPSVNRSGPYVWLTPFPERLDELPEAPTWAVEMLRKATALGIPRSEASIQHVAFDGPPVSLGPRALQWWSGERVHAKPGGEVDRSETLFTIGLCLASRGATEGVIAAAVADRDRTLGYEKYVGRSDGGDQEYRRIAAKALAASVNLTPAKTNTQTANHASQTRTPPPTSFSEFEKPQIVVTGRHLHEWSAAAWDAVDLVNEPPRLFQLAGAIAEVRTDEQGRRFIKPLSVAAFKGLLDRVALWMREKKDGLVPARPPRDVIDDMMALDKSLPAIRGVVGTPIFTASGQQVTEPGYQPATRLYYAPVGLPVAPVPAVPTAEELERAKALLFEEWLYDFPFVDQAARASVIAGALTPLAREMILGPTPLLALDAPTAGTGKGLLAETVGIIVTGAAPAVMNDARQEEEVRKRITSVLLGGHPVVLIDNVKRRLTSATLAALLTATSWADRILGGNDMVSLPNRSLWMTTGNNLDFDFEIARRTIWARLDARLDRPSERVDFRHERLSRWVQENRHELVWALLVILQNWIAKGRPAWTGVPLGSFESWCDVVGGALNAAGIEGFLENRNDLYRQADTETEEWRAFLSAWWGAFGANPVKAAQLLALTQQDQLLLSVFATARDVATERSLVTRLGAALMARHDRRYGSYFIRHVGQDAHAKGSVYRLEPVVEPAEPIVPASRGSAEVPQPNGPLSDSDAEPAERAEPETRSENKHDHRAPRRDLLDSASSGFEVPQVPHLPQPDSKAAPKAAEPVEGKRSRVPQEVPHIAEGQQELRI